MTVGYEITLYGVEIPDTGERADLCQADVFFMSSLLRLLISLLFRGVRPEDVRRDQYPGKTPPTVSPRIPNHFRQDIPTSSSQDITRAYKAFKKRYPNGRVPDNKRNEWLNNPGLLDE